jgi:hypothetical protein
VFRKLAFACAALAIVAACIYASTYYRLYFGDSIKRGAELRKILGEAKSVTAYEYAMVAVPSQPPVYSELLAEKNLSPAEVGKFIEAFSATGKLPGAMCFEPHHLLRCTMGDKSVYEIHICFQCSEIQLDRMPPSGMCPWSAELKQAFADCGLPVRPDRYRVRRSASTDSGGSYQNP